MVGFAVMDNPKPPIILTQLLERNSLIAYEFNGGIRGERTTIALTCWKHGIQVLADIAEGIAHMHERRYIHGDINPRNIFVSASLRAVVGDVGLSVSPDLLLKGTIVTQRGTPGYTAPEADNAKTGLTFASDVYSFGRTAKSIVSGCPTGYGRGGHNVPANITTETTALLLNVRTIWKDAPSDQSVNALVELLMKCCSWHSQKRPNMHDVFLTLEKLLNM